MKRTKLFLLAMMAVFNGFAQKHVGINTTNPLAALHVADSSVLFSATGDVPVSAGNPPVSGAGRRMMWYPDKAAFRVGYAFGNEWDNNNIGYYSFATGYNSKASGIAAVALGSGTQATGPTSIAIGINTLASGYYCTALGANTTASGSSATAIGHSTTSSGDNSCTLGTYLDATGRNSISIGTRSIASGDYSMAMGIQASTNGHTNSICMSGVPNTNILTPTTFNTLDNQMMMRFDNYTFWVSSSNYAYLIPASNGWAYTSDRNKKERMEELDGETVLQKISGIPFYSWNFKAADVRQYRHYGIMAQDFYNAFGRDSYGVIGNDTTVSPLDILGVDMAAIKALEKRSQLLLKENETMKTTITQLQNELADAKIQLQDKMRLIEARLNELLQVKQTTAK